MASSLFLPQSSPNVHKPDSPHPRLFWPVFLVFFVIYLSTWAGHYTSGDGRFKIDWAKAMILGQPATIAGHNTAISKYGIGHSLLAMPPLAIAYLVNKETGIHCEAALYTLMWVINGSLFLALLAFYLGHFFPARSVWLTVLIAGLATSWWPYTKMDLSEPLVLTVAFLGFVLMRFGRPFLGMLVAAFTLAIRGDCIVIVIPLLIWYLLSNRSAKSIPPDGGLLSAPSVALIFVSNYIRYHSLFDHGLCGRTVLQSSSGRPVWHSAVGRQEHPSVLASALAGRAGMEGFRRASPTASRRLAVFDDWRVTGVSLREMVGLVVGRCLQGVRLCHSRRYADVHSDGGDS